ncbi:MAG: hypothetical protein ACLPID_09890 [Beijerinckiaceae bacterium]
MLRKSVLSVLVLALALPALDPAYADNQAASGQETSRTSVCHKLVDRYKALLKADPAAPFRKGDYPASPIEVLAENPSSGVTIASSLVQFDKDLPRSLTDWAQQQKPPIAFSKDALDELAQFSHPGANARIAQLPDTQLYRLSTLEGTASCYSSKYFFVEDGRARMAPGPQTWSEENGAGCGVTRDFGKIDGDPVALEDDYATGGPEFGSDLTLTGWDGENFVNLCTIHWEFSPRFLPRATYNQWEESCTGTNCVGLRQAAFELVEAAELNPAAAQKSLVKKLSPSQRAEFMAIRKLINAEDMPEGIGRLDITDRGPVLLPLISTGHVYLARAGRLTIGWRVFSDWSVVVDRRDTDKMVEIARFAVGVSKGKLLRADVK